ncbi:YcnI family protein [uncultured Microbacterium sp.]|uniref:YcnI family copper-binding membrane protein n=1 Tax=uncultured Microbacterium sp. TaxID=191216 RepID=UPI0035CA29A3
MHSRTKRRPLLVGGAAVLGAVALTFAGATAASAHVTISPNTDEAGAYAILTLSVPHGCDGSPTTSVSIQIPQEINAVTPTRNSFYSVEKVKETLATPLTDSHGNQVTERVAQIVYTAMTPLPADQRDAFELSVQLPEDAAGTTLYFPTVQTCEQGETSWVQIPADGQAEDDLEHPSPAVAVVAAAAASDETTADTASIETTASDTAAPSDGGQTPLLITSLVVGALGLVVGATALFRSRKKA